MYIGNIKALFKTKDKEIAMKKFLLIFLLFPFIAMSQNNTVIEPKVNAQTLQGLDTTAFLKVSDTTFGALLSVDASNVANVIFQSTTSDTIQESFSHVHNEYRLLKETILTDDVSNPPTDAELDNLFGTPASVGAGFYRHIDDAGGGSNFYKVISDGTNWWVFTGTKAL